MLVTQKEINPLHLQLQIHIAPEDYKDKLDQELRKYRSKANLRGFRKGMAPLDVIKRMAGKPILAEVINELVSNAFTTYLKENNLDIFLEPLPVEEVEENNRYSATQLNEFNFEFEIGIKPEIEVAGISQEDSYTEYEIEISEDQIDKEVEHFRKDRGKREDAEEIRDENDFIRLNAVELDGSETKEGGISSEFSILLADCKHGSVKQEFIGKKIGESLDIDIFELEDLDEDKVYKYFLKVEKNEERQVNRIFRVTIRSISRIIPAELNDKFFESLNDENVTNIEELRNSIRASFASQNKEKVKEYVFREIMESMIEKTSIHFPEEFFRKYLKKTNPDVSDEDIENDFGKFLKNLKWITIKEKLLDKYGIEVNEKEVENQIVNETYQLMVRYGIFDQNRFREIISNRMKNSKEIQNVADKILTNKLMNRIYTEVTKISTSISMADFNEKYKAMADRINKL